jgi:hypothetical protein
MMVCPLRLIALFRDPLWILVLVLCLWPNHQRFSGLKSLNAGEESKHASPARHEGSVVMSQRAALVQIVAGITPR